jgi:carbamoyltransferase
VINVLGINAAFHDGSAALIRDGVPLGAAEEERFTRIKHAKRPVPFLSYQLPFHAIAYVLQEAGISLRNVDRIAYSFDPGVLLDERDRESISLPLEPSARSREDGLGAWEPLFLAGIVNAPRFLLDDIPHHLQRLRGGITHDSAPPFEFVEHHLSHAASAYYVSGFPEAAILTLDGRGEKATTLFAIGRGRQIEPLEEVHYPHSLGLLYEHVTDYLGFLRASDEYKVMALASVGSDRFVNQFRRLVELGEGGQYRVDFADLEEEFGPRRRKGEALEQRHFDVAEALQRVLEETVLELARRLRERTGIERLCLAGGVALNCVMNSRLRDASGFREMFVQPAAGDAGTALGAAYVIEAEHRPELPSYKMTHAYLGPGFTDERIRETLVRAKLDFEEPGDIAAAAAELLAEDKIIGWFQGRMEFGPRALGARSIVASPRDPAMKDRLNEIKDREDFRPVAPAVLEERAGDYFAPDTPSPYMLFIHDAREERKHEIPAVCHYDGSARIQTVSKAESPIFHRLIEAFGELTGTPVVVNTSFNTLGQPIVCTPEDALECYFTSPLDALAIGPFLLTKARARSSAAARQPAVAAWGLGDAR